MLAVLIILQLKLLTYVLPMRWELVSLSAVHPVLHLLATARAWFALISLIKCLSLAGAILGFAGGGMTRRGAA